MHHSVFHGFNQDALGVDAFIEPPRFLEWGRRYSRYGVNPAQQLHEVAAQ